MRLRVEISARASVVIELAKPLPQRHDSPACLMLVGPPGVGKTTFAEAIRRRIPMAVIESDAVRKALFPRPRFDRRESGVVFDAIHEALRRLLGEGHDTLVDATNLVESERVVMYQIAGEAAAHPIIVRLTAPPAVVRRRLQAGQHRGFSTAGIKEFERLRRKGQPIARKHYVVDTTGDTQEAVEAIAREIEAR